MQKRRIFILLAVLFLILIPFSFAETLKESHSYIRANGKIVADNFNNGTTTQLYHYYYDVLGNLVSITDQNGKVVESQRVEAFGNELQKTKSVDVTDRSFIGKEKDSNNLFYFGARYYDANTGRFISSDPLSGKQTSPQSQNKYTYAVNNPLKYVDLNGKEAWYKGTLQYAKGEMVGIAQSAMGVVLTTARAMEAHTSMNPVKQMEFGQSMIRDIVQIPNVAKNAIGIGTDNPYEAGKAMGGILFTAASIAAPFAKSPATIRMINMVNEAKAFTVSELENSGTIIQFEGNLLPISTLANELKTSKFNLQKTFGSIEEGYMVGGGVKTGTKKITIFEDYLSLLEKSPVKNPELGKFFGHEAAHLLENRYGVGVDQMTVPGRGGCTAFAQSCGELTHQIMINAWQQGRVP